MTGSPPQVFEARMDRLPLALAFVEAHCARQGVAAADALRLALIVEELFTNTVVHGHRGDHASPVRIGLAIDPAHLRLCYEDCAPPFNPLQYLQHAHPDLDAPADERRIGGLGLPLVAQMVERFDYAHVDGFNCLALVLRREA
jgi:anti-sigma regulatory factor (Ser/Thr protein kinase)